MQRPLYGLAVDLTPHAVVGLVASAPTLSAKTEEPAAALQGAATTSANASEPLRRPRHPEPRWEAACLVAAAIAFAGVAMTMLMAASRSGPAPATAALTASPGKASAASQATGPVATSSAVKAVSTPKPAAANKASVSALVSRSTDPSTSRSEPADANLSATLERLRQGIR